MVVLLLLIKEGIIRNRANKNKEQLTEKILQTGKRLFAKYGFYKTQRGKIRRQAKVGGETLSSYFEDKEGILNAKEMILVEILDRGWRDINQSINESCKTTTDVIKKLKGILSVILDTFEKDRELRIIFMAHSRELYELGKRLIESEVRKLVQMIESIFAEGQERGILRKDLTPKSMQRTFFGAIEEFLHSWTLKETVKYQTEASREQLEKTIDSILFAFLDKKSQRLELEEVCLT